MTVVASLDTYSFAFNGFVFGGTDNPIQITFVDGLEDLPLIRNQDDNRGYSDGMFTGRDFYSNRTIVIEFQIFASSTATMQENLALFKEYVQPQQAGTQPLQFQLPGYGLQRVEARVRRRNIRIDPDFTYGKAMGTVEFFCPDPLIYDDTVQELNIFSPLPPSGRTYNRVYDMTYGGGAGVFLITNNGWTTTYPTITITGPCVDPVVVNNSTGEFLAFTYAMTVSDVLFIDTNFKTVTLNGSNRRAILNNNSTWFAAPPGTSVYSFRATSGTSTGTSCVVSWRSAYI